jgi:hypothetical protein
MPVHSWCSSDVLQLNRRYHIPDLDNTLLLYLKKSMLLMHGVQFMLSPKTDPAKMYGYASWAYMLCRMATKELYQESKEHLESRGQSVFQRTTWR